MRGPQGKTRERLEVYSSYRHRLFLCLCEQRHRIDDAPAQSVRHSQGNSDQGEIDWEVRVLTEAYGMFEPGECPGQVALAEGEQTDPRQGTPAARRAPNDVG